jgi:hypothetical protein
MARYVAKIRLDGKEGLGVVVPRHILTCAHYIEKVGLDRFSWLEIHGTTSMQEETVFFVQTLDCRLDFMVLGDNPLGIDLDSDSWLEPVDPEIKPYRICLPKDQFAVKIDAYFFAPDGITPVQTHATVSSSSPWISLDHPVSKGSSGGPLFTSDHRLIGIIQGTWGGCGGQAGAGSAIRIDQAATGWLFGELNGLEEWCAQGDF